MLRRLMAPMLLVFPLVLLAIFVLIKLTEPVAPKLTPEEVKARELGKVRELLRQWEALPADARQAAASQLVTGLDFPLEDLLWETTWTLGEMGPTAVPALVAAIQDPEATSQARVYGLWALGLIGPEARDALPRVKESLTDPAPEVRGTAAFALSQIDTQAGTAVPLLIPLFADPIPEVNAAATQAIARYRDQAVPSLRKALADPNAFVRKQSVVTLGLMGEHAGGAVTELVAIVRDPNNELRAEAAEALGHIGAPALASLAGALKDPSDTVRLQAADALSRMGRAAAVTLASALKDENINVRFQALNGLSPHVDEVLVAVIDSAKDPALAMRELAVQLLGLVRQDASRRQVVAPLLAALTDPETQVRRNAAFSLRRLQPPAEQVLPVVQAIMESKDPGIRDNVLVYLYSAGFHHRAVPFLVLGLKDPDDQVRARALQILEEMKLDPALLFDQVKPLLQEKDNEAARVNALSVLWRSGPAATPALLAALDDPQPKVRRTAIWALHQGSVDSDQVLPKLLPRCQDTDAEVRASVMAALHHHGAAALPHLAAGLGDAELAVRKQAITSLGHVQAKPADVLPLLEKVLQDPNEELRAAAAAALEPIGAPAVELLIQTFRDKSDKVWKRALQALIKMPADNRILLPIMTHALRDPNPSVRTGAAYAMERFEGDAVKPLLALLKSKQDEGVHWAVVDVIDTIGDPARSAFPDLIEPALTHPSAKVRYGALMAMLKMHGLDRYRKGMTLERYQERFEVVIPHLIRSLSNNEVEWRWQAAVILGVIGPRAKEAIPALKQALEDPSQRVRDAAREALARVNQ